MNRENAIDITVEALRKFFDGEALPDELETELDLAQGAVFSGESEEIFVIIRVIK